MSDIPSWITAAVAVLGLFGGAIGTAAALFSRVRVLERQVEALTSQVKHLEEKIDTLLMRSLGNALGH